MNNSITYEFTTKRFGYTLPLMGVTAEFISNRRVELARCTATLQEKIKTIDITNKQGVADFSIASHLVGYYSNAKLILNHEESKLGGKVRMDNPAMELKHRSRRD